MAVVPIPRLDSEAATQAIKAKPRSRQKTKSGCRTCKLRKVKCDEARPSCNRCKSTGRICEGYGIWGGGDADDHYYTAQKQPFDTYRCLQLSSILAETNRDDRHYFEWFRSRTCTKLPGLWGSGFWEVLVLQVSHTESAALHALLAVGCAHKRLPTLHQIGAATLDDCTPDEQERFILRHYSQAIRDVQKCFSPTDGASVRVMLVVCMLFAIMEFMRKRPQAGMKHLRCGMDVINSIEARPIRDLRETEPIGSRDSTDQWLHSAFARMNLQALSFGQKCAQPRAPWQASIAPFSSDQMFRTIAYAKDTLEDLFAQALELAEEAAQEEAAPATPQSHDDLVERQTLLQSRIDQWLHLASKSEAGLHAKYGFLAPIAYRSLMTRHLATKIMAARCLIYGDEGAYDRHTKEFCDIINNSIAIHRLVFSSNFANTQYAHKPDVAPFVVDGSWIWPLYYTALKCRVRRLRLQALRLLESAYSLEAVCDTITAVAILREVIEIEEDGLSGVETRVSDFEILDEPRVDELLPPALSPSARLYAVQVIMPDTASGKLSLTCKRKDSEWGIEVLSRDYDFQAERWVNKTEAKQEYPTPSPSTG